MLSYETALQHLLADAAPRAPTTVAVAAAAGHVLAQDIAAKLTLPPAAVSAMDGYAIRWAERKGPWKIIGESAAGRGFSGSLDAGTAVRIFTGAPVPGGADTVIIQEDVERGEDGELKPRSDGPPHKGAHIRGEGMDFGKGDPLIAAGTVISARHIGLAAAAGHATLRVYPQPRVYLLATGDELVQPGHAPGPDQIISSNGAMLGALLESVGAKVTDGGIARDDPGLISAMFKDAAQTSDLILTIGGASVGDHDHVRAALDLAGAETWFWKVAIKPGKPMIAGRLDGAQLIGLPGNPVSAFVCALLFACPVARRMRGLAASQLPIVDLPLAAPLGKNGARRDHLRAHIRHGRVAPMPVQGSAMLQALAGADALIIRPPGAAAVDAGEKVPVLLLDRFQYTP